MGKAIDLTGQKFGRLTVIKTVGKTKSGGYRWLCQCDCSHYVSVDGYDLRTGHTKSCGCLRIEIITKHGHNCQKKRSQIYQI